MSRFLTDEVFIQYFEGYPTDHELTSKDVKRIMCLMIEDDPVVMEELAHMAISQVDWQDIARAINHDAGCT